jgi:hypothetical protein
MDLIKMMLVISLFGIIGVLLHSAFVLFGGDSSRLNKMLFVRIGLSFALFGLVLLLASMGWLKPSSSLAFL